MERLVSDVGEYLPRDGQDYDSNASNTVGDSDSMSRQSSFEQQDMSGSRSVSLARQQLSFGMTEYQHSQHQTLLDRWEPAVDVRSMQMRGDVPCPEPTIRQPSFCYGVTLQPAFQPLTQRQSFVNKNPQVYTNTSQTMYSESVVTSASQVTYQGAEQTLSSHIIKNPNVLNYSNMGDSALPSDQKSFEANLRESNGKFCGVCGDVARSYHFGGLSCDSCKAFFRRSVQNDNYMRFQCYHTGQCVLSVNNRKSCQYCRMRRCFEIGMEKSWVMTEEERKALMKIRSEKKLTKQLATAKCITVPVSVSSSEKKTVEKSSASSSSSSSSPSSLIKPDANDYVPLIERMTDYLSLLEIKETESIVTKYAHAYQQVPYRSELRNFDNARPGFQSMEMFGTLVRRFAFYARMMADFASLPNEDQRILLKGGVFEMCLLRGALAFDPINNRWPNTNMSLYKETPVVKLDDITHLTSSHLFQMHLEFISSMKQLCIDEPTIMMLVLIVLFTHRTGLLRPTWVEKFQAYYVSLLEHYTDWRFGPARSNAIFSKLLTKLSDLRELCETHNARNVNLGSEEILSIQQQLQHLNFNPYPELNISSTDELSPNNEQVQEQERAQAVGGSQVELQQPQSLAFPRTVNNEVPVPSSDTNCSVAPPNAEALASSRSYPPSRENSFCYPPQAPSFSEANQSKNVLHSTLSLELNSGSHLNPHHKPQEQQITQAQYQYVNSSNTLCTAALNSGGPSFSYVHSNNESLGKPGPSGQGARANFTDSGIQQFPSGSSSFSPAADMSMQLMRAMHQSVSQVLDQPHFGFEWVEPDYRFDGFGDAEDLGEVLNEFTNCQASSSRQHDTSGHTSARNQSSEAENKKGKTEKLEKNVQIPIQPTTSFQPDLTSNAMEELYYELERYSELYNQ